MSTKNDSPVMVLGATGATGSLLAAQLLERGATIKCIVRDAARLPDKVRTHPNTTVIEGSVTDMSDAELRRHLQGCASAASCLGHNLTFGGMFGKPRDLCTATTRRVTSLLAELSSGTAARPRFVLMNTTGAMNIAVKEQRGFAHRAVLTALRWTLPPHNDNEQAAWYLQTKIGDLHPSVDWCIVRPDGLVDEDKPSRYALFPAPTRDCIFNSGTTSRINVAHFMANLLTDDGTFQQWRRACPVIYNTPDAPQESLGTPLGGAPEK